MSYQKIKSNQIDDVVISSENESVLYDNNNNTGIDLNLNRFISGDINISGNVFVNDDMVVYQDYSETDGENYYLFNGENNEITGKNVFIDGRANKINGENISLFKSKTSETTQYSKDVFAFNQVLYADRVTGVFSCSDISSLKGLEKSFASYFNFSQKVYFNGETFGDFLKISLSAQFDDVKTQNISSYDLSVDDALNLKNGCKLNESVSVFSGLQIYGDALFESLFLNKNEVAYENWITGLGFLVKQPYDQNVEDGFSANDLGVTGSVFFDSDSNLILNEDFYVSGDFTVDTNLVEPDARFFNSIKVYGDSGVSSNELIATKGWVESRGYISESGDNLFLDDDYFITGDITVTNISGTGLLSCQDLIQESGILSSNEFNFNGLTGVFGEIQVGQNFNVTGDISVSSTTGLFINGDLKLGNLELDSSSIDIDDLVVSNSFLLNNSNVATESWVNSHILTGFDTSNLSEGFNAQDSYFLNLSANSGLDFEKSSINIENLNFYTGQITGQSEIKIYSEDKIKAKNAIGNISYSTGAFNIIQGNCNNLQIKEAEGIDLAFTNGASENNWILGLNLKINIEDENLDSVLVNSGEMHDLFVDAESEKTSSFSAKEFETSKTKNERTTLSNSEVENVKLSLLNSPNASLAEKYINSSSISISKGCLRYSDLEGDYKIGSNQTKSSLESIRKNLKFWWEFGQNKDRVSGQTLSTTNLKEGLNSEIFKNASHWDGQTTALWGKDQIAQYSHINIYDSFGGSFEPIYDHTIAISMRVTDPLGTLNNDFKSVFYPDNDTTTDWPISKGSIFVYDRFGTGTWLFYPEHYATTLSNPVDTGWTEDEMPDWITFVITSKFKEETLGVEYSEYKYYLNGSLIRTATKERNILSNFTKSLICLEDIAAVPAADLLLQVQNIAVSERPWTQSEVNAYNNDTHSIPYYSLF